MLIATQVFSSLGIGLLVGILLGLSSAPVVGLVVGSITALLASLLGLKLPARDSAAAATDDQLPQAMVQMLIGVRAGTFGFACVVGIFAGIYMRTHDLLSPPARGLEARYAELLAVGFDPGEARNLLISPPATSGHGGEGKLDTRQTVLFSIDAENCSQLSEDRFASLSAAAAYYRGRELDWLADIAEGLDAGLADEDQKRRALAAVVNVACRAD